MVGRYFILSGIPMSQIAICKEIENMVSSLVEDLTSWHEFEFLTKRIGRRGPTKEECLKYYNQK